jgi:hypothetical protein
MRLVGEAVELGADLSDLGVRDLLVAAAFVRRGVHDGALHGHIETPGRGAADGTASGAHLAGLDSLIAFRTVYGFM